MGRMGGFSGLRPSRVWRSQEPLSGVPQLSTHLCRNFGIHKPVTAHMLPIVPMDSGLTILVSRHCYLFLPTTGAKNSSFDTLASCMILCCLS